MKTTHEYHGYVFTITQVAQTAAYTVDYPDFPDIITSSDTLTGAFAHACEALDLHLAGLQSLNLPIPSPRHQVLVQPITE